MERTDTSEALPSTAPPTAPTTSLPAPGSNPESANTSNNSSDQEESYYDDGRRSLTTRPALGSRKPSASMIVPANHPEIEVKRPISFPPGDARAMSPRRSDENVRAFIGESRSRIQSHAIEHQAGLNALIEKIESIKSDHQKLERDNNALQEYIGGLTRSMSRTDLTTGRKK